MPSHPVPRAHPVDLARFKLARIEPAEGALRIGVIAARFNGDIVDALLEGALRTLAEHDVRGDDVVLARVAGAWELPQIAQAMADSGEIDAVVALGCIIRGETSHYDVIVNESARALMDVSLKAGIAVANGVLAVENIEQAIARCGGEQGNKGSEAALAAIETAGLIRSLLPEHFDLDDDLDSLLDDIQNNDLPRGAQR
ncbi:MAG: 6,7-dimethyl-8-ribityllumazine synthase [Rhodanobacteraceae bacterium]|nr:6,7-dimethyl-8-ribityllumazine synthase [Rhodanobacteraceae bacterium]MBK7044599.1 6,7-dimethyl-8-ribityllumazine synthase [Rhodanobacteraceae bacterium]MBP9155064.1 6,7-dimethyl-8-ribityllumazine synthase [Xanthomonadales bacterium]HQW81357.1 6,7-dimethyl-8-ribityllumazine synthase [Pseudomonadota bacterium]